MDEHPHPAPPSAEAERGDHSGVPLDRHEQEEARERTAPPATVVYEAIYEEAQGELRRPTSALFWSALAAGLSLGFSFLGVGLLRAMLPEAPWAPLIYELGYTFGFLVVVLGRQQLFTENTLTPIIPLLREKSLSVLANVLRLWAVVLVGNLLGAFLLAWLLSVTDLFSEVRSSHVYDVLLAIGEHFLGLSPEGAFVGGVFAGWLLALMVWMMPYAETEKVFVIGVIAYLIGLGGFAHCITGSVETMYAVLAGPSGWGDYAGFLVPTLLGNIVGGVTLVAALNHAQVVAGQHDA